MTKINKYKLQHRKHNFRAIKQPILIVCEDSKSSVLYFKEKIKDNRISPISVDVDGNSNSDPMSVVNYAINKKIKQKKLARKNGIEEYAFIYCVMDVDNHTNLKPAIDKAKANNVIPIVSNQCFELWYLLHFIEYSTTHLHRIEIYKKLDKLLGKNYDKSDNNIYYSLKDKEQNAIELSKRLLECAENESTEKNPLRNPSTEVHVLIEKLNSL